jgi:hypothetical protein
MSRAAGRSRLGPSPKTTRASRRPDTHRFGDALTTLPLPTDAREVGSFVEKLDEAFVSRLLESGALENTLFMAIEGLGFWRQVLQDRARRATPHERRLPDIVAADAARLFEDIYEAKELHGLLRKLGLARPAPRARRRKGTPGSPRGHAAVTAEASDLDKRGPGGGHGS